MNSQQDHADVFDFALSDSEASALRLAASTMVIDPYQDLETFLTFSRSISRLFPSRIVGRLAAFVERGNDCGALIIRNLPQDHDLPPTPVRPGTRVTESSHLSELWMCCIAVQLGEPFAYLQERNGDIFQEVFPTREHASNLSSQSSAIPLDYHTEMMFHPHCPDHLLLYGLRQDSEKRAQTMFSSVREFLPLLSESDRNSLFCESFTLNFSHIHSPYSVWGTRVSEWRGLCPSVAVLYGSPSDPFIRYEPDLMTAKTPAAARALEAIEQVIHETSRTVAIEPGCLLILDNRRCVHARSMFAAKFDGSDRWLRRMHILRTLEPSSPNRLPGSRVIDTDLGIGWADRSGG